MRSRHATRGRPRRAAGVDRRRCSRSPRPAATHFDQQYDDLAVQALRYLAETGGDEAVLEFARRRVAFIERDYATVTAADPDADPGRGAGPGLLQRGVRRVRAVAAPAHDGADGRAAAEQLCQQHCPVSHVAHEFPQLCEAETEAIGHVLGRHVQRLATIAHGDGVCTTCIPHARPPSDRLDSHDRQGDVMTSIEELNPELKGIGRYQFGWADRDDAGAVPSAA